MQSGEALETQIEAALDRYLRAGFDEADATLDRLDRETGEEKDFLENCRPGALKAGLGVELDKVANDVNSVLGPAAVALARRRVALENFVADNGLERTIWWGRPITRQSIYLMLGITLFEFLLNTAFFSGSPALGNDRRRLAGDLAVGDDHHPRRRTRHRLSILASAIGGAGLVRQARRPRPAARRALLSAAAYPRPARRREWRHPYVRHRGTRDPDQAFLRPARSPALAYFFFSIAVIAGVFYKFIDTMGHYPRIRSHTLAVEKAEADYEDIRIGMIEAATGVRRLFPQGARCDPRDHPGHGPRNQGSGHEL